MARHFLTGALAVVGLVGAGHAAPVPTFTSAASPAETARCVMATVRGSPQMFRSGDSFVVLSRSPRSGVARWTIQPGPSAPMQTQVRFAGNKRGPGRGVEAACAHASPA